MTASHLAEFDACLPIILNHIASDIRLALLTHGIYAVRAAGLDVILPDVRDTPGVLIVTTDLDAVLMGFLDHILDHVGFIVLNFYTCVIQREDILNNLIKIRFFKITYIRIDIHISDNT